MKEKVKTSEFTVAVAKCEDLLKPCAVSDVQIMLETICSTFSCSAPEELGQKKILGVTQEISCWIISICNSTYMCHLQISKTTNANGVSNLS